MRLWGSALIIVAVLAVEPFGSSQDTPLGDVARQTRTQNARSTRPAKVFSNEDSDEKAVTATDDSLDVVTRSGAALFKNSTHSCRREASGNSGPGWSDVRVVEMAGSDRAHITMETIRPKPERTEWIIIGDQYYRRTDNGPWQKLNPQQAAIAGRVTPADSSVPDVLKFRYDSGALKLIGPQNLNGTSTYQYQYVSHSNDFDRTINIWVGANDNLPRQTEMLTVTRSWGSAATVWRETSSCEYRVDIKIDPPL